VNLFDILGPVMVGPSSSHTAGAARIGLMARTLLGGEPVKAAIHLHGSFAETGTGHGTDMALAGVESRIPVDEVIDAMGEVGRRMPVEFRETALGGLAATPTGQAVKERLRQA